MSEDWREAKGPTFEERLKAIVDREGIPEDSRWKLTDEQREVMRLAMQTPDTHPHDPVFKRWPHLRRVSRGNEHLANFPDPEDLVDHYIRKGRDE
jgi:hypothetical protein